MGVRPLRRMRRQGGAALAIAVAALVGLAAWARTGSASSWTAVRPASAFTLGSSHWHAIGRALRSRLGPHARLVLTSALMQVTRSGHIVWAHLTIGVGSPARSAQVTFAPGAPLMSISIVPQSAAYENDSIPWSEAERLLSSRALARWCRAYTAGSHLTFDLQANGDGASPGRGQALVLAHGALVPATAGQTAAVAMDWAVAGQRAGPRNGLVFAWILAP